MSHAATVTWLAVRELWMTFRLLVVLIVHVGAGAVVGLLPAPASVALQRLAVGLALAAAATAGIAAWSMASERVHGRAGWLVTRSVARGTYLGGWFAALALVAAVGGAAAGVLGWLAVEGAARGIEPFAFPATVAAVVVTSAAAAALGLLCGSLLRPPAAFVVAVTICVAVGAGAWLTAASAPWLPGGAHVLLARIAGPEPVLADALRAAGIGLALSSALLVAARAALERTDL